MGYLGKCAQGVAELLRGAGGHREAGLAGTEALFLEVLKAAPESRPMLEG